VLAVEAEPPATDQAVRAVAEVLAAVRGSTIDEVEVEWDGGSVRIQREPGAIAASVASPQPEPAPVDDRVVVKCEHVGIFHAAPNATLPAPGERVAAGARLAEIETLGIRSAVVAPIEGTVAEVLIEEGLPVEYGQPLFVLSTSLPSVGPFMLSEAKDPLAGGTDSSPSAQNDRIE